jgi:hypothetical protein
MKGHFMTDTPTHTDAPAPSDEMKKTAEKPKEIGGPKGLEPTRYGDWDVNGRCSDF